MSDAELEWKQGSQRNSEPLLATSHTLDITVMPAHAIPALKAAGLTSSVVFCGDAAWARRLAW